MQLLKKDSKKRFSYNDLYIGIGLKTVHKLENKIEGQRKQEKLQKRTVMHLNIFWQNRLAKKKSKALRAPQIK